MAYAVNISSRAERDLAQLYAELHAANSGAAGKWYRGFRNAIQSLSKQPTRCPAIPENDQFRHLLYGHKPHTNRVIYRVREKQRRVEILHVRHGTRRRPSDKLRG
jgi:plasmid stabilization system protein ParE